MRNVRLSVEVAQVPNKEPPVTQDPACKFVDLTSVSSGLHLSHSPTCSVGTISLAMYGGLQSTPDSCPRNACNGSNQVPTKTWMQQHLFLSVATAKRCNQYPFRSGF